MPAKLPATMLATECIKFGWETFKKRPWFFIGVTLLIGIANWIIGVPYDTLHSQHAPLTAQVAAYVISFLLGTLIYMGTYHFALKTHDGVESVSLKDLWRPQHYVSYVVTTILVFLIVAGGLILLIVPGFILMIMFSFPFYPIIERGLSPVQALTYSKNLTAGHRWELFLLMIASFAIGLLGLLCLLVGLLIALPVVVLANVHAYRTLQKLRGEGPAPSAPIVVPNSPAAM